MEKLTQLLENFDLANFLPQLDTLWGTVETLLRIFVMAGPLILLGLALVCTLIIHLLALIVFDWKGVRRSEKRKNA